MLYSRNAVSSISKNSHTPAKNIPAIMIGSIHNCLIFLPAKMPHTRENTGSITKKSKKQTAIPESLAKVAASQGTPNIKITEATAKIINFFIQAYSFVKFIKQTENQGSTDF